MRGDGGVCISLIGKIPNFQVLMITDRKCEKKIVPKDAKCSETDFLVQDFCSFQDIVDFVLKSRSELRT